MNECDEYSGLRSRAFGIRNLEQTIAHARSHADVVSILFSDFDNYKSWNARYGHQLGDVMLRQLASMVEHIVGQAGMVARWGGDEFLVVLPGLTTVQAKSIAQEIRDSAACQKVNVEGDEVPSVTMTIVVASYPDSGEDAETLIRVADETLWQSRRFGKNAVYVA